jgi:hypothetical protein
MATRKNRTSVMRSKSCTSNRRQMTRNTRGGQQWSSKEISFMRRYYRSNETKWVARQLGRTVYSVRYKASSLNIRKANPSVWRGNKGMNRPAMPRRQAQVKARWARTPRRTFRKASSRQNRRMNRR